MKSLLVFVFLISIVGILSQRVLRSCSNVCGMECENACGTNMFKPCCLNYVKKRNSVESLAQNVWPLFALDPALINRLELMSLAKSHVLRQNGLFASKDNGKNLLESE